jgi:RNA polymerase sigma factor (sigma-70 family)
MIDDTTLLRRYAEERAEDAFAEFVRRQLPLVYSAALRRLGGDTHGAEDIAQVVFSTVARDAHKLSHHAMLTGWLYTTTRNAVIDMVRADQRRRGRETEAQHMQDIMYDSTTAADWSRLSPVLDTAMDELSDDDREAVLLRFFRDRPFAEIGSRLGLSEDTARKRVERALDKLRMKLQRHGIGSTSAALATILAASPVSAAPEGLAASVTGAALASEGAIAGAAGGTTTGTAALLTAAKLKIGIAALLVAGGTFGLISQQLAIRELREAATNTRQQLARLAEENAALARARTGAEKRNTSLVAGLAESAAAQPGTSGKATGAANRIVAVNPVAQPPASKIADSTPMAVGPLPDTPKIQSRKAYWHRRYDPFFTQIGLTPAEGDRFVELKIHQEIEREEFQKAVKEANLRGDSAAVQALRSRDVSLITRELRELLGDEGYRAYGRYEETSYYRLAFVEPLQRALTVANVPLTPEQAEQMVEIFRQNARHIQSSPTDIGTTSVVDWDAVIAKASGLLTPAQAAVLQIHAGALRN